MGIYRGETSCALFHSGSSDTLLFSLFFGADRKAGMTGPGGGSAKSNSGVYLWTSVGVTPTPPFAGDLLRRDGRPEGMHTVRARVCMGAL